MMPDVYYQICGSRVHEESHETLETAEKAYSMYYEEFKNTPHFWLSLVKVEEVVLKSNYGNLV